MLWTITITYNDFNSNKIIFITITIRHNNIDNLTITNKCNSNTDDYNHIDYSMILTTTKYNNIIDNNE